MRPHKGPSLPQTILDELDQAQASNVRGGKRHGPKLSRKEARKADRDGKKQRKATFFSAAKMDEQTRRDVVAMTRQNTRSNGKRHAPEIQHADEPKHKKQKTTTAAQPSGSEKVAKPKSTKRVSFSVDEPTASTSKLPQPQKVEKKTALQKLAEKTSFSSTPVTLPRKGRSQAEKEEDAYIEYLERQLGYNKSGKRTGRYGNGMDEDGLDDLLADIDKMEASVFDDAEETEQHSSENEAGESEGGPDEDSDLEALEDGVPSGESEEEGDELEDRLEEEDDNVDEDDEDADEAEWGGIGDSAEEGEGAVTATSAGASDDEEFASEKPIAALRGRAEAAPSEEQLKLTRQLKGLLNRMSEQNIASIVDSIEEIYRKNRRHDVTSTLTRLIIDGISNHAILLDSYVVLHAAFVSALHKLIGVEFAAYFVQNVVASYEKYLAALQESTDGQDETETKGKECSNLIVLLSELYNFQVVACVLVYDIIRGLLDGELDEVKVELLLKIARNSGNQLRTDDPSALKDIIQIVHSKIPAQQNLMSSRARFMVETLSNLKNNKVRKDAGANTGGDAVERLKKFLTGLTKKQSVRSHEPLRVTLADLHTAESKGKWWLVGAAWGGDPLVDRHDDAQKPEASSKKVESAENLLLKLAKKQGMNTDIRRSIFVVLMSSEDYVDACERLSQLKLTEVQQREIVRVILHCCGNEKLYNPYYSFVGQQLCRSSHSYKITLQFCLWDFLRDLGETNVGGTEVLKNLDEAASFELGSISSTRMRNVARAYAWWIAKDACTLAILKPVDFTVLKPQTLKFFNELFTHLFANTQLPTPLLTSDPKDYPATRNRGPLEEVFIKATRIQALSLGLIYFLGETFRRDEDSPFLSWAAKVAIDTLRTGADVAAGL